ncbi:chromosome segregation ATPase [Sedimentibacter acidaminivorans]|uniref:Chromosome segregation ATPase n=1 Tax=Sedimentibacter acidaminivorans TaxID=913099 RepID=A0ABS4GAU7_9FIRM|nr:hypothetical protein [Sedimentibacter acidaminivorans]MBP1924805.1 chromosome segregation ATPase [Sedimentibacter acidaminivorans]
MSENINIDIDEMFRDKTLESDLEQYLKKSIGGYTKKSVQDYLYVLRQQQKLSQETFARNLQDLFEEKESIKKNNDSLLAKYNRISAEYDNLAESFRNIKLNDSEFSAQDLMSLKGNVEKYEEEVKATNREKNILEKRIIQQEKDKEDLQLKLEHSIKETEAQKQILKSEKLESKKQRDIVADLYSQLEVEKNESRYLKGVMSERNVSQLSFKVNELTEQLSAQTDVISKLNSNNLLKDETIDTLTNEIHVLKLNINNLSKTVEGLNVQNEKLILSNDNLKSQLEKEYKNTIMLINEKSNVLIDKYIAQRKLSDAESEFSLFKLEIEKNKNLEGIKSINNEIREIAE